MLVIRDTSTGTIVMRFAYISRSIGLSVGIGPVAALRELHERGGDKSDMTRSDCVKGGAFLTASVGIILIAIIAAVAALVWVAILVI